MIAPRAATTPERIAVVDAPTGRAYTYRDLDALVDRLADRLSETMAARTDETGRVAMLSRPRPASVALVHAAWRSGYELVPLRTTDPSVELARQIDHANVDVVFVAGSLTDTAAAVESRNGVSAAVRFEPLESLPADVNDVSTSDVIETERTRRGGAERAADAIRVTMFTSGSTGTPKAVQLTAENLLASATASAFRLGVEPGDRWLSPLPLYHMGGFAPAIRCALYGATVVLQREFDSDATAAALADHEATGISLVPTALKRLLDDDWTPDPSLRFVLLGGAPASPDLIERCEARDVPVHPTYGMTETASQIATATPEQAFADPETVGQPLVNTTVRVLDDAGTPVPPGEEGELVVAGPTVTPGYLDPGDDAAGTDPFDELGFSTGDRGYRDSDGFVYVTGRVDDLIVTGGENVSPARIEAALEAVEVVRSAAVVGLQDDEWGQRVVALVEETPTAVLEPADLRSRVRTHLADHEVPKTIVVDEEIPRTSSGTVDRDAVRARIRSETSN